jgi:hypothetical protein
VTASSRRKGADAERELATLLRAYGLEARRNLEQPRADRADERGDLLGVELAGRVLHVEAKRCERLDLPRWLAQLRADCPPGRVPLLVFRRSREGWQRCCRWRICSTCWAGSTLRRTREDRSLHLSLRGLCLVLYELGGVRPSPRWQPCRWALLSAAGRR